MPISPLHCCRTTSSERLAKLCGLYLFSLLILLTKMGVDPPAPFHPTATRRVRATVRVGVGVIVRVPGTAKVYAGIRKGSHGAGSLALPGGHLEMFETWEDCAKREIKEEMDLELKDLRYAHVTNDIMEEEGKHYVTIFMMGTPVEDSSLPKTMEPEKCEGWEAYSWEDLKCFEGTLFGPLQKLIADEPEKVYEYIHSELRQGRRQA